MGSMVYSLFWVMQGPKTVYRTVTWTLVVSWLASLAAARGLKHRVWGLGSFAVVNLTLGQHVFRATMRRWGSRGSSAAAMQSRLDQ